MSEQRFPDPNIAVGSIEPRALKESIDDGTEIFLFDICGTDRSSRPISASQETSNQQTFELEHGPNSCAVSQDTLTSE
jgi:hypothetical protein